MSAPIIRRATLDDLETVIELSHALAVDGAVGDPIIDRSWALTEGKEILRRVLEASEESDGWECCWVVVIEDEIVGFLEGGLKEPVAWRPVKAAEVRSIFVREPFRGQGLGRGLMSTFFEWSRDKGVQAIELSAFASNERAIAFYRRLGFAPTLITLEHVLRPSE